MVEEFSPLTIPDCVSQALTIDQRSDSGSLTFPSLAFPLLGLFGEIGSLLSESKKHKRDRASYIGYAGAAWGSSRERDHPNWGPQEPLLVDRHSDVFRSARN